MRPPFVLLTGFSPFGGRRRNESACAVRATRRVDRGVDLVMRVLPVSWARAYPALRRDLADPGLRAVILCGEAPRRPTVSIEGRAHNRCSRLLDVDRRSPTSNRLVASAPAGRASSWPAPALARALRKAGVRAVASSDAGGYLCNAILFRVLGHPAVRKRGVPVTFVHLPIPGHGALDGTTPAELALAVRAVVAEARERFLPGDPLTDRAAGPRRPPRSRP